MRNWLLTLAISGVSIGLLGHFNQEWRGFSVLSVEIGVMSLAIWSERGRRGEMKMEGRSWCVRAGGVVAALQESSDHEG